MAAVQDRRWKLSALAVLSSALISTEFITPSDQLQCISIVSPLSTFSDELLNQYCTKCLLDTGQFSQSSSVSLFVYVLISPVQVEGTLITDKPLVVAHKWLKGVLSIPYIKRYSVILLEIYL